MNIKAVLKKRLHSATMNKNKRSYSMSRKGLEMRLKIANFIVLVSIVLLVWPVLVSAQEIGTETRVVLQSQADAGDDGIATDDVLVNMIQDTNQLAQRIVLILAVVAIGALAVVFQAFRINGNSVPAEFARQLNHGIDFLDYLAKQTESKKDDELVKLARSVVATMPVAGPEGGGTGDDPAGARG